MDTRDATGKGDFVSLMTQMWGRDDTICVLIAFVFMTSYRPFALKEKKESPWEGEGEKAGAEEVARAEEEEASKVGRRKRKLR